MLRVRPLLNIETTLCIIFYRCSKFDKAGERDVISDISFLFMHKSIKMFYFYNYFDYT